MNKQHISSGAILSITLITAVTVVSLSQTGIRGDLLGDSESSVQPSDVQESSISPESTADASSALQENAEGQSAKNLMPESGQIPAAPTIAAAPTPTNVMTQSEQVPTAPTMMAAPTGLLNPSNSLSSSRRSLSSSRSSASSSIQETTHTECRNGACVIVFGPGTNQCASSTYCGTSISSSRRSSSSMSSSRRSSSLSSSRRSSSASSCALAETNDLSVTLSASQDKAVSGGNISYTMTMRNKGKNAVTDAFVYMPLEGMSLVSSNTGLCQADTAQDRIRCQVNTMAPASYGQILITLKMTNFTCPQNGMAVKTKYAYIATLGNGIDIHPQDNTSNFVVTDYDCGTNNPANAMCKPLKNSDLSITLTQDKDVVKLGELVQYTMKVVNKGKDTITDATAYLPIDGMFVSGSSGPVGCYVPDGMTDYIRCPIGVLASGNATSIGVSMLTNTCPQNGLKSKTKFAYVASNGQNYDPQPQDNTSRFITTVLDCAQ